MTKQVLVGQPWLESRPFFLPVASSNSSLTSTIGLFEVFWVILLQKSAINFLKEVPKYLQSIFDAELLICEICFLAWLIMLQNVIYYVVTKCQSDKKKIRRF